MKSGHATAELLEKVPRPQSIRELLPKAFKVGFNEKGSSTSQGALS